MDSGLAASSSWTTDRFCTCMNQRLRRIALCLDQGESRRADAVGFDMPKMGAMLGWSSEASRQFGGAHPLLRILMYFLGPFVLNAGQDTRRTLFESSNGRCATSAILESGLYERQ